MPTETDLKLPTLDGWALILGASSGFGGAACSHFAQAGMNIVGVHLDRRANVEKAQQIASDIQSLGREAWFYNVNAADPSKRSFVLTDVRRRLTDRGRGERFRVFLHSLAFGALRPFTHAQSDARIGISQMDMTLDVMANSLVYWTQELIDLDLFDQNSRIYAMTSTGSGRSWVGYGAVSAAKAALESHVRQLSLELSPRGITSNAICAGVTDTPALRKIPENETMIETALRTNPSKRLTRPEDVARALVALAQPSTYWMTGNVICIDGGESHTG